MLNARTWHWLCVSAFISLPAIVLSWTLPHDSPFRGLVILVAGWGFVVGFFCAIQGILLVLGRLHMGCPVCNARARVVGGDPQGLHLDCPGCGDLQIRSRGLFGLEIEGAGSDEVEEEIPGEDDSASTSIFHVPRRYRVPLTLILLPAIGSIIAASLIHQFTFFHLLIPGFWCYGVGYGILHNISTGRMNFRHGKPVFRSKSPFRFWLHIAFWSLGYLFAAWFPIGYALQESAKAKSGMERELEPALPSAPQKLPDHPGK